MSDWISSLAAVEALEDLEFDPALVARMQQHAEEFGVAYSPPAINFYTPTFKSYQTSELAHNGRNAWPALSITGAECKLQCDHCKAKILEPMIPVNTPESLWRKVNDLIEQGAQGMLLTGGSNHRNEVEYDAFYPTIRRIKDEFSFFKIAMHTALVTDDVALSMEQSGIDAAMMDVIGSQETITQVYHLKRSVDDFEQTLESLVSTNMKVVPHIVLGLHYGEFLGEWNALQMLQRHRPSALVLVVVMPQYAPEKRPFRTPDVHKVGEFFLDARASLVDLPVLLGCARPAGEAKSYIDAYAVMSGLSGIAHPTDGVVELAVRLGHQVRVTPSCCSIAVGDEVMGVLQTPQSITLDLDTIVEQERHRKQSAKSGLASIKIVVNQ